jgi:hypothetical protein
VAFWTVVLSEFRTLGGLVAALGGPSVRRIANLVGDQGALRVPAFQRGTLAHDWVGGGEVRWRAISRRVLKRFETVWVLGVVHISSIVRG